MPSVSEFHSHYRNCSDDELEWLSIHRVADLVPEAQQALREETERRGLRGSIEVESAVRRHRWTKEEVADLVEQYRRNPCPECGQSVGLLNAVNAAVTHGFVVMSTFQWKVVVGCSSCIDAQVDKLSNQSLITGWWSLPWGPIYTIRALIANAKAKERGAAEDATPEIFNLVLNNLGEIVVGLQKK